MEKIKNSIYERDSNNKVVRTNVNYFNSIFTFLYDIKKITDFPKMINDASKYIKTSKIFVMENLSIFSTLTENDFKRESQLYKEDYKETKKYIFDLVWRNVPDEDWKEDKLYRKIFGDKYENYSEMGYIIDYFVSFSNKASNYNAILNHVKYRYELEERVFADDNSVIISRTEEAIEIMIDNDILTKDGVNYFLSEKFCDEFYLLVINFRFFDTCIYKDKGLNAEKMYNNYYENITVDKKNCKSKKISIDQLLEYLNSIVKLNSNIISLKKRYSDLENLRNGYLTQLNLLSNYCDKYEELFQKKEKLEQEIKKLENKISQKFEYKKKIFLESPSKPSKPTFLITPPNEPIMKKPNLFNKKKVEEENKKAINEYNVQKERYEKKYNEYLDKIKKYKVDLSKYEIELKKIKTEEENLNKKECIKETKVFEKNIELYKNELVEKNKELEKFNNNFQSELEEMLLENDRYKQLKAIDYEMQYIRNCIKENIIEEKKLYSYDILYGKYQNYVAVCSFLDYFKSGRCDALDGPNGAYNIFEQESHSNIIINKLDNILKSLDDIKNNQFYIYNELKNIDDSLNLINGKLLVNNILQVVQITELSKIIDNTNEIAYNTSVSAYYSKIAANSAKAIAVMNFLDSL